MAVEVRIMAATRGYSADAFNSLPFRDKLEVLYGVSATEKRDLILSSPEAQRLVRSFAPESLFYTLKEIGPQDGVELLSLASGEQVCSLVDLDCWKKDRLDSTGLLGWLEVVLEAGDRAVGEFLHAVDLPLLVLFLKRYIRVLRQEDPEEPVDLEGDLGGHEIFELDEHYRIEFLHAGPQTPLVRALLEGLYERDYSYFVTVMEEVWWGVESELEETSFQLRNARLQDRGFPDYFEALDVYRPLAEGALAERLTPLGRLHFGGHDEDEVVPLERSLLVPDEARSFLSEVMTSAFDFDGQNELRQEMAFLTNRVMIAEGVDYADREAVAEAVRLAHDTANLAVEVLSGIDRRRAADVLATRYLQHLFRFGWGLLLSLRRRTRQLVDSLDVPAPGGQIDFLDSPYREALMAFLRPKPRFFEGIDTPGEIRHRPFATLVDLEHADALLADVSALPKLCQSLLGQDFAQLVSLRPRQADEFRLSASFLTAFAHGELGDPPSLRPLARRDLKRLRQRTRDPETGRLLAASRRRFLEAARGATGTRYLELCLDRFESEFLTVATDVDPRFVTCLMIEA